MAVIKSSFSISPHPFILGTKTKSLVFGMDELTYGGLSLYDCPRSLISVILLFGAFLYKTVIDLGSASCPLEI